MPVSSPADVASVMRTRMPAFTHAIAIPPPIVPAPTMPTVATGAAGVSFDTPGTRDTPRSAKNA